MVDEVASFPLPSAAVCAMIIVLRMDSSLLPAYFLAPCDETVPPDALRYNDATSEWRTSA